MTMARRLQTKSPSQKTPNDFTQSHSSPQKEKRDPAGQRHDDEVLEGIVRRRGVKPEPAQDRDDWALTK